MNNDYALDYLRERVMVELDYVRTRIVDLRYATKSQCHDEDIIGRIRTSMTVVFTLINVLSALGYYETEGRALAIAHALQEVMHEL